MSLWKAVVPAVALASGAYAQSSCSTSGTLTITNTADASPLAACQTYSGSIAIATDATEVSIPSTRITENLIVEPNGMITSLSAPSLRQVDGQLSLTELQQISTLSMPSLMQADQFTLRATGQNLLNLNFGNPGLSQVSNLTIDGTYLQDFTGINLQTAGSVMVTNNQLLEDLSMQIRNVTGTITIRGNTNGLSVNMPNLKTAGQVLINDCSTVNLPSLTNVTETVALIDNTFMGLALPKLAAVGPGTGGFNVQGNMQLSNLSTPALDRVAGGVVVTGNPKLTQDLDFPELELAGNGVFAGAFSAVNMPALRRMPGTLKIRSTKNIQSTCQEFRSNNAIGGDITCMSAQASQSASSTSSSSTSTGNAALNYGPSPASAFTVFGGLAALFGLFM